MYKRRRGDCEHCGRFQGQVARAFRSEDEFIRSPFYGGGDRVVGDPNGVTIAVWPGKHNVYRRPQEWWLCSPLHPFCNCSLRDHDFDVEDARRSDWYAELVGEAAIAA